MESTISTFSLALNPMPAVQRDFGLGVRHLPVIKVSAPHPRIEAKLLGGCSTINAMMYIIYSITPHCVLRS